MKNKRKDCGIGILVVLTTQEPSLQPFPMINIRTKEIRSQLDTLDLDALARECRVDTGYTKKIRGRDLMLGVLLLHNQQEASLEQWAGCIESFSDQPVSKQAVNQRCTPKHVQFFERVARAALGQQLNGEAQAVGPALKTFNRVLVEDSTCVGLDRSLASAFPSSHTERKPAATARLQLQVDLKEERTTGFHLASYRDNDQSYSAEILKDAEPGDLVIRDLGYFVLQVLQDLKDQGSFFLSRLRYGVVIKDPDTGARIDLFGNGGLLEDREMIDMTVQIGKKTPVTVRLVGQRVPEEVANKRRREAKKDRHANANHSTGYMRWLGWNFFVTNVGPETWSVEEAIETYQLRWRIEIVFKALKSCFEGADKLENRQMSADRVRMMVYGWLIYSAPFIEPTAQYFARQMARRGRALSLMKYCQWLRVHYVEVLTSRRLAEFVEKVARHCVYDKRHDRRNYHEQRQAVGESKKRAIEEFP